MSLWTQAAYLPGLYLAGLLADYKNGKYFALSCLLSVFLLIPVILFVNKPETFILNSEICYFTGGFFLMYMIIRFIYFSTKSDNPLLVVCSFGIISNFFYALGALVTQYLIRLSEITLLSIYSLLIIIIFLLLYFSGTILRTLSSADPIRKEEPDMEDIVEQFRLTDREKDVLALMVSGITATEIAAKLFITERTVRYHMTNIYGKTETKSRVELIAKISRL